MKKIILLFLSVILVGFIAGIVYGTFFRHNSNVPIPPKEKAQINNSNV